MKTLLLIFLTTTLNSFAHADFVDAGLYQIQVKVSRKCLDVATPSPYSNDVQRNGRKNGEKVQQWDCQSRDYTENQKWELVRVRRDLFQIVNLHSQKCLDVHAPDLSKNGGKVQQWDCLGQQQRNQLWRIQVLPGRNHHTQNVQIQTADSGKCLDIHAPNLNSSNPSLNGNANALRAQIYDCLDPRRAHNQVFSLRRVEPGHAVPTPAPVQNEFLGYGYVSADENQCFHYNNALGWQKVIAISEAMESCKRVFSQNDCVRARQFYTTTFTPESNNVGRCTVIAHVVVE